MTTLKADAVKSQSDASVPALNVVCASADELNSNFFEDALRVLTPGGSITITLPTGNSSVKRNLMFSGFTSVSVSTEGDLQKLSAIKPEFDVGAAAAVKLNPAIVATENNWNFDMDDGEEIDLIADSDLLKDDMPAKPVYDCGPGAGGMRKACKDCSCGLADEERSQELAAAGGPTKSACGSCAFGDAFRCATCPSLGLPAWKNVGDTVKLDL